MTLTNFWASGVPAWWAVVLGSVLLLVLIRVSRPMVDLITTEYTEWPRRPRTSRC